MADRSSADGHALVAQLDDPEASRRWLAGLGVRDPERAFRDVRDLVKRADDVETVARLLARLHEHLPRCPDPGMALTNLERFVAASPDSAAAVATLGGDPKATEVLVQLFSTSQYFSDLLIREPGWLAWLRGGAERRDAGGMAESLWDDLRGVVDDQEQRLVIRRYRRREMLRIGYNDIIRDRPLEVTTLDLSHLAGACVEAAYRLARGRAESRHGLPRGPDGLPARFVVLALGKLGGEELNYSSDIDLIYLYDSEGQTDGPRSVSNAEFFARMGGDLLRLLADHTSMGQAYRVDMRLRPEGDQGPLARSTASTLAYYQTMGRTWERQALIKCRPVAGDLGLGREFLDAVTPFVHRRFLGAAEIAEIKAMKRRIEQRTLSAGTAGVEVKTGHGGIRDVEFVVQFLQLLHGGEYPEVRHPNTLIALNRLEAVGCLTSEERTVMEDAYRFLRRVEHRLQTMFDRQTHRMPTDPEELRTLAVRMGYAPESAWEARNGPAERFLYEYRARTSRNRRILNHLLHDAFLNDAGAPVDPVVDLVLDPEPSPETVAAALSPYPFRDRPTAYANLMALAREEIPFLSQARCRHFLAAIAPRLLSALGATPDPDLALTNLEKVSASLGAKAILWELFSHIPPALRLFVELCASSQFLSEVLINSPGMIDDLIDSLVDDRPQPADAIKAELGELCRGAEDLAPIVRSFRNKEWVRVGTRDILGREPIRDVTRELADVAEAVVGQVARDQESGRSRRWGCPLRASDGKRAHWAVVGMGKLGGRELNFNSDLDLVFVYDEDGTTSGAPESVSNEHFFGEVVRRTLKFLGGSDGQGPLYTVDTRLRPHGASGPLLTTLDALRTYYACGVAQPWERLALTRARVIFSTGGFGREVSDAIRAVLCVPCDPPRLAHEVIAMRRRLEDSRGPADLRRGAGGAMDIEFLVQYLQLVHASMSPEILRPNVWEALDALRWAGVLSLDAHEDLVAAYNFHRTVESRLRIAHSRTGADLPDSPEELARLARRLGFEAPADQSIAAFRAAVASHASRTRAWFRTFLDGTPVPRVAEA